jgi:hypothetical protein
MDGTYRDDHEAAIARADALDRELARVRAERDDALVERDLLRDRLARPRFEGPPPLRRGVSPASIAGGVSVLTVGLIATAVATVRLQPPPVRQVVLPVDLPALAPPRVLASDLRLTPRVDDVVGCIELARAIDPSREDTLSALGEPSICAAVVDGADARWSPAARQQLAATADALRALELVADRERAHHDSGTAYATARAMDAVRDAAWRVDLSVSSARPR